MTIAKEPSNGSGVRRKAMLQDKAILTGGRVIVEELNVNLEIVGLDDLGKAKRVVFNKDSTVIIEGGGAKPVIEAP